MEQINQLKVIIALLGASSNYNLLQKEREKLTEEEFGKFVTVCLIRVILVSYSIKNDWPIEMCATTNLIITVLSRHYILNVSNSN